MHAAHGAGLDRVGEDPMRRIRIRRTQQSVGATVEDAADPSGCGRKGTIRWIRTHPKNHSR